MNIISLTPDSFGSNCYILIDGGHAVVIDSSLPSDIILEQVKKADCVLDAVLLTHGHFDHILSLDRLRQQSGVVAYLHGADAPMLTDGNKNAYRTFFGVDRTWSPAEESLTDGQILTVGQANLRVIHTPGHSSGSCCFLNAREGWMLTGDTLFADSYGRCDLWGGSIAQMRDSLQKLRDFDGKLTIYPGHGRSAKLSAALDNAYYL
jgi:glyoxylase-like metal-dependent hydrolase (beta-lactamase superfamily II)